MKYVLGIDVGGTKIAAGLVDERHRVSNVLVVPTSQSDLIKQLADLIASFKDFSAIGLGLPGPVLSSGVVNHLGNIPHFKSTNIKQLLQGKFKKPVSILNDAKAFALAEATIGVGKSYENVVGIVLGTGIGIGFVLNKQVYFGYNGLAGEIARFEMPNGKFFEPEVKKAGPFKTAKKATRYLRSLMSFVIRSFDPEVIIIGGGWANLPGMQAELNHIIKTMRKWPVKTQVRISKLKHAGIIGAAQPLLKK